VFGTPGRRAVRRWLPELRERLDAGFVVVNVENVHAGKGIDAAGVREVLDAGADCLTSGNHAFAHRSHAQLLDSEPRLLRPANYPAPCPGRGVAIGVSLEGVRVAVINLIGRLFMQPVDDPFRAVDEVLDSIVASADVIVVDFHAEATSEKAALAHHLDGRIAALFGTHTHVQTADARVLPGGTGFISDIGMTGPHDSVIGLEKSGALERFRSARPSHVPAAEEGIGLRGALFEIDDAAGRCMSVTRVARGEGGA
jgi:metallophosphoesterase (TIGR00282 family)